MCSRVKPSLISPIEGKILSIEDQSETATTFSFENKSGKTLLAHFPNVLPKDVIKKKFKYELGMIDQGVSKSSRYIHVLVVEGGKHYCGYTKTNEILNRGGK